MTRYVYTDELYEGAIRLEHYARALCKDELLVV